MKNNEKSITELIIELQAVNRRLDRIKNDPKYIEEETNRIFGNKHYYDKDKVYKDITAILDEFNASERRKA